ncbi:MAG: DNA polymerase IV [Gemmatimonadaceae bacterium]|nr:DNA polymerase IV [Gemmatimonadaceae bacterium]
MSPPARRILLVDADAFFVSVAKLVDPDGAGRAPLLIVGGSAERRGVVTSASYETRAYGVRSGMPMARALRLCPQATVVGVPRGACGAKSREIMEVLRTFSPTIAAASIDEWYVDLGGTEALYAGESLQQTAHRIRASVHEATRLSVSIGGGTSRLVAKLAAERAKPKAGANGVHIVPPGEELAFMRTLVLADIPGVGPKSAERLATMGLRTVDDALGWSQQALSGALGEREGSWLHERVRGIDRGDVVERTQARSISRDETFSRDIADDGALQQELMALAYRAAADLRGDGLRARTVTVRIRDGDFTNRSASRTLPAAIESDRAVYDIAGELLAKLRHARRVPARLLSVALTGLSEAASPQLGLFGEIAGDPESPRDRAVSRAVDAVRAKFGGGAISPGKTRD